MYLLDFPNYKAENKNSETGAFSALRLKKEGGTPIVQYCQTDLFSVSRLEIQDSSF